MQSVTVYALQLMLTLVVFAYAGQTQKSALTTPPSPAPVTQPSPEQKGRLAALARLAEQKARDAEQARANYMIELLATLGELGLKPSETTVQFNEQGEPVFGRAEPANKPEKVLPNTPKQQE